MIETVTCEVLFYGENLWNSHNSGLFEDCSVTIPIISDLFTLIPRTCDQNEHDEECVKRPFQGNVFVLWWRVEQERISSPKYPPKLNQRTHERYEDPLLSLSHWDDDFKAPFSVYL